MGTWCTTKRESSLNFFLGPVRPCCVTSLPLHCNKDHCFKEWPLRAFVKLKIINIIEIIEAELAKSVALILLLMQCVFTYYNILLFCSP